MAEERGVGILRRLSWLLSEFRLRAQMPAERLNFHSFLLPFGLAQGRSDSVRMTGFEGFQKSLRRTEAVFILWVDL